MGTELQMTNGGQAVEAAQAKRSLVGKMAATYGLEAKAFLQTIKTTVFPLAETNEQLMALLVVADHYQLNPFLRGELYAFPQSGGVVPVVGVDGWYRIANRQQQLDGWEWTWADQMVKPQGAGATCPEWCQITIFRKDRTKPVTVREYLDEVYRPTAPWKSHPKRMLRHKCFIQGMRAAFGIGGIYDEDEADRIMGAQDAPAQDAQPQPQPQGNAAAVLAAAGSLAPDAEDVTVALTGAAADVGVAAVVDPVTGEVAEDVMVEVVDGDLVAETADGVTITVGRDNLSSAAKEALGITTDDDSGEQPTAGPQDGPEDDANAQEGEDTARPPDAPESPPTCPDCGAAEGDAHTMGCPRGDFEPVAADDAPELPAQPVAPANEKQKGQVFALAGQLKLTDVQRHRIMQLRYQKASTNDLTADEASDLIDFLQHQIASKAQLRPPQYQVPQGDA